MEGTPPLPVPVTVNFVYVPSAVVVPISVLPELSIRIRSVDVDAPSAVVLKVRAPGVSPEPGVPSISAPICATCS